jgi:hypothetical protein
MGNQTLEDFPVILIVKERSEAKYVHALQRKMLRYNEQNQFISIYPVPRKN